MLPETEASEESNEHGVRHIIPQWRAAKRMTSDIARRRRAAAASEPCRPPAAPSRRSSAPGSATIPPAALVGDARRSHRFHADDQRMAPGRSTPSSAIELRPRAWSDPGGGRFRRALRSLDQMAGSRHCRTAERNRVQRPMGNDHEPADAGEEMLERAEREDGSMRVCNVAEIALRRSPRTVETRPAQRASS